MLFKDHTMTMITDPRMFGPEITNSDFVTVAYVSSSDEYTKYPNFYDASILQPPTEILMRWADGDPYILQTAYPQYLANNKDADDMIVALLTALTKKNIILFIPTDEYNVFGPMLLQHIYFTYGITMNTPTTRFSFNESKLPLLISKFYMMDLMEPMDYIKSYPGNLALPSFVINKLAVDLHPFENGATFEQYANYFNRLVAQNLGGAQQMAIKRVE